MNKKAFVVGYPIHHSLSPFIHQFWLQFYQIEGCYEAHAISSDNFNVFLSSLKKNGFIGGNVTLPYKEQAFQLADYCDEAARAIGAANSLWFDKDVLCASNSDAYGFSRNLSDFSPNWCQGKTALILGAGGAARAVIFALKQQNYIKIILGNRTKARAEQLAEHFGNIIKVIDLVDINHHLEFADLIVNTTSIGLNGNKTEYSLDFNRTSSTAIVTDIVYTPLETPFLKAAKAKGLKTVDGLGMLLHQAVFGFERWFGVKPTVNDELRHFILEKLAERK